MRTLLLTVLVSFNLVACVAGDNGAEEEGIDGIAETQADMAMDVGMAEHQVRQEQDVTVDLQARPGTRQNRYHEGASQETLADQTAKVQMDNEKLDRLQLEQEKLGRELTDVEQEELFNPNRIEQVDMVELLRGVHASR